MIDVLQTYVMKYGGLAVQAPAPFTAITTPPSFFLNGSGTPMVIAPALTSTGEVWANTNHNLAWVFYLPVVPVQPTDQITMSTTAGWATCSTGSLSAQSGVALGNYLGQLEPGFDDPTRNMLMGINVDATGAYYFQMYSCLANSLLRGQTPSGIATSDTNGHPLTLSKAITFLPVQTNQAGAVDNRGIPTRTGTHRYWADESNPANPMVVTGSIMGGNTGVSISGPVITITSAGKCWEWTTAYTSYQGAFKWQNIFQITVAGTGSGGSGNYTLSNESFTLPGNNGRPKPWQADQVFLDRLTTASGKVPSGIRCMGSTTGPGSNMFDPGDAPNPSLFLWGNSFSHVVNISAIRNFDTGVSPNVWWAQQWTDSTQPGGGPVGAPNATPSSQLMFDNLGNTPTLGFYTFECVFDNTNYQLKSGQSIIINGSGLTAIPATNGNLANTTVNMNFGGSNTPVTIFLTSPTTFIAAAQHTFSSVTGQGLMNTVAGSNAVTATASTVIPGFGELNRAVTANLSAQFPGCKHWLNFAPAETDASATIAINQTLANFPGQVVCEYTNETWNSTQSPYWIELALGAGPLTGAGPVAAYVARAAQLHTIATMRATAAGRGSDIIRCYSGQYVNPAVTLSIVSHLNAYNAANPGSASGMDVFAVADYVDPPNDTTMVWACASTISTVTSSIAFGAAHPWTINQVWDMFRHHSFYNTTDNGPTGHLAGHIAALKTYVPVGNQPAGFVPALISYEGGINSLPFRGITSPTNTTAAYGLAHDMEYSPGFGDWWIAKYLAWQNGGMTEATPFCLCNPRLASGDHFNMWGLYRWDGQQPGDGSTNTFFGATGVGEDFTNVSVAGNTWREWADQSNPGPAARRFSSVMKMA